MSRLAEDRAVRSHYALADAADDDPCLIADPQFMDALLLQERIVERLYRAWHRRKGNRNG